MDNPTDGTRPMVYCWVCARPVTPPRRHYCCDSCAAEGKRRHKKPPAHRRHDTQIYYQRPCQDCGLVVDMHIKSKRCPACQHAADLLHDAEHKRAKAAGHTRHLGDCYPCERCGDLYVLIGSQQRYCKSCASTATRANVRAIKREERRAALADPDYRARRNIARRSSWQSQTRACAICNTAFTPPNPRRQTCSDSCQTALRKQQQHDADLKRSAQRSADRKAERAAIKQLPDDEQQRIRDEINVRARANYARRKASKDASGA